ncbi:MAG: lycopene cyclase domain-containing protein [Candidatus Nanoarchaeia archaeon]|nr:lycopene cyclase domain-containing protein [Candidatus Nanoarchaeia archaeon]MDD5740358.1 lycopene cyclase domain-containing protein [Candidatus Nanoarchaeia archaeon]
MLYQYNYLIGDLILLVIWIILFLWRKDTRKEMLYTSLFFGFIGLIVESTYGKDWWHPQTITNTLPGPESFIFGFVVAGIAAVIYSVIFSKKVKIKRKLNLKRNLFFIPFLLCGIIIFFVGFYLIKLNSFYSSIPAFLIPLMIMLIKRKDLIINSLASGFLLMIISFVFYVPLELITPGWINSAWNFNMVSGITLIGVPIEDLIWFFLAGLLIGPLYEYWQKGKLINKK